MPNNLELIFAAAGLINAAGDCIEKDMPYNDDLIEALADMQAVISTYGANMKAYWYSEFDRLVVEKIGRLSEE